MKLKTRFGIGLKKRKRKCLKKKRVVRKKKRATTSFNTIIKATAKSTIHNKSAKKVINSTIKGARKAIKKIGDKSYVKVPRILPVSAKIGGFLPYLISLFARLRATRV